MTATDRGLVRRKLATIVRNLRDLATVADLELNAYRADRFRQKGTERLLQETIEAAVDVNLHLARAAGAPPPGDYYGSFVLLGELGASPRDLAAALALAAGRLFPRYVAAVEAAVGHAGGVLGGADERE